MLISDISPMHRNLCGCNLRAIFIWMYSPVRNDWHTLRRSPVQDHIFLFAIILQIYNQNSSNYIYLESLSIELVCTTIYPTFLYLDYNG